MSKEVEVISGRMRQTYSDSAKRRLVEESYASSLSLNQFARKAGISPATLCQWRKVFKNGDCTFEPPTIEGYEELRLENQKLKQEVFKLKAYLGHKLFEFEGIQIA